MSTANNVGVHFNILANDINAGDFDGLCSQDACFLRVMMSFRLSTQNILPFDLIINWLSVLVSTNYKYKWLDLPKI